MGLIWKLLRQHISIPQFTGFFLANLVGMTIVLLAVQFYADIQAVYTAEDGFVKDDYLIINKRVSTVATLTGQSKDFGRGELQDIAEQPFVEQLGAFTSSAYDVKATFRLDASTSFATEMFFEAVPDEFVDVTTEGWTYEAEAEADEVPIILPRSYLDLYNFGYAQSRSLPKLSEGILGAVALDIEVAGNGERRHFIGRIEGFSSRLNTILVPQAFMDWANERYAPGRKKAPARLILKVDNPTDERITTFLKDNGYETDQDKLQASKTNFLLRVVVGVVMSIGLVISALAFYILMLSIYLLVEKNNTKLENLLLLGYSPARVSLPYQLLAIGLNALVLVLAVVALVVVRGEYLEMLQAFFSGMTAPGLQTTLLVGIGLLLLVSLVNMISVKRKVMTIWKRKD